MLPEAGCECVDNHGRLPRVFQVATVFLPWRPKLNALEHSCLDAQLDCCVPKAELMACCRASGIKRSCAIVLPRM